MTKLNWLALSLSSVACFCARAELAGSSLAPARSQPATLRQVRIEDRFWAPKLKVYREQTIPHSWQFMQGELRALQAAGGQSVAGELNGTWGEANLYKFLEMALVELYLMPSRVWTMPEPPNWFWGASRALGGSIAPTFWAGSP
jgi:hypothetical protein